MLFIGSPFFLSVGHVCLNCWEIKKLSPFPFPSFVYPFCLFFSAFPYHLDPSLPGSLASLQALKRSAKGLDTAYKLWPCSCLSLRCQELDLRIVLVPPTLIPPSGSVRFSMNLLAVPFLTRDSCCLLLQWHWFHILLALESTLINQQRHL